MTGAVEEQGAMPITYATNAEVNLWRPWQRQYRFGILLMFPPEPPTTQVNALREKHDPWSQASIGAHITLTVPFSKPPSEAGWNELLRIASQIDPIVIQYGPLRHYLPHPGVCLAIEPQGELGRLVESLEAGTAFEGAEPRPYPFSAHITIAEFITEEETRSLMVELKDLAPQGSFLCSHVSYAVPDGAFCFKERVRLMLRPG